MSNWWEELLDFLEGIFGKPDPNVSEPVVVPNPITLGETAEISSILTNNKGEGLSGQTLYFFNTETGKNVNIGSATTSSSGTAKISWKPAVVQIAKINASNKSNNS